ncbi:PH domain-containing protein [Flavobacterium silvaticum]|uniref:Bacterial Pleckstrin homology domain-containing protein n=1 Tax=Flavobacterium silvaticum TaxID=1852020 RepID=A0A972JJY3_9FLAO|nr:PH domain-containing protein [Flavobacterium silvaticum]NMH28572.1 hypothetical protein [Flavobacterium silvaticum]
MKRFDVAPLDKMSRIISFGIGILFLSILGTIWLAPDEAKNAVRLYPTIMLVVIFGIAYGLKPSAYVISADKLLVKRPAWNDAEFRLSDISSIVRIESVPNKGLIRTLGCGGLFGYYGYFSNHDYGSMTWYLTRRKNVLMLEVKSEKVLVSPKDTDAFLSELRNKIDGLNLA